MKVFHLIRAFISL